MVRTFTLLSLLFLTVGCAGPSQEELERIALELNLGPGAAVADVGAGDGALVPFLSAAVGTDGVVFATEIDADAIAALHQLSADSNLENVRVVTSEASATGLEAGCCDAIVLRNVYHHLTDPSGFLQDLASALRDEGRLLVIDFHPAWVLSSSTPEGLPEDRDGHGVLPSQLIDEATENGFVLEGEVADWPGSDGWLMKRFAVLFGPSSGA